MSWPARVDLPYSSVYKGPYGCHVLFWTTHHVCDARFHDTISEHIHFFLFWMWVSSEESNVWPCLQPVRLKSKTTGVKVSLANSIRCKQNKTHKALNAANFCFGCSIFYLVVVSQQEVRIQYKLYWVLFQWTQECRAVNRLITNSV